MADSFNNNDNSDMTRDGTDISQSINVLTKKMREVECNSDEINERLKSLGFATLKSSESRKLSVDQLLLDSEAPVSSNPDLRLFENDHEKLQELTEQENYDLISPYKIRTASVDTLRKNYELLVNRLCHVESQLQSIKLHVCSYETERKLSCHAYSELEADFSDAREDFLQKISDLEENVRLVSEERDAALVQMLSAEEGLVQVRHSFEGGSAEQDKLRSQINELAQREDHLKREKELLANDLTREVELRQSLEKSQSSLLDRVTNLEADLDEERRKKMKFREDWACASASVQKSEEQRAREKKKLVETQNELLKIQDESGMQQLTIKSMTEENSLLLAEMSKISDQYRSLNDQLSEMTKNADSRKRRQTKTEVEKANLLQALETAAEETAQIVRHYETELKKQKRGFLEKEHVAEIRGQLRQEVSRREKFENQCKELHESLNKLEGETVEHRLMSKDLTEKLQIAMADRDRLAEEKNEIMKKVNTCVDGIQEEKNALETRLVEARVEVEAAQTIRSKLESANCVLSDRVSDLERQTESGNQLQTVMADLLTAKQKLAHEKGQLQSKLDFLQTEVDKLGTALGQLQTAKRSLTAVETKFSKSQQELSQSRIQVGEWENKFRQSEQTVLKKQRECQIAYDARDEAVREAARLLAHCDEVEERERQRVETLQKTGEDYRTETRRAKESLDSALNQNNQLQSRMEQLQEELGSKEVAMTTEKRKRKTAEDKLRDSQLELDQLLAKIAAMEHAEINDMLPLRQQVSQLKTEISRQTGAAEDLTLKNEELRSALHQLQDELSRSQQAANQERLCREEEFARMQIELRAADDRLNTLRQQLANERAKNVQRMGDSTQEIEQLRLQNEFRSSANDREREELRAQLTESTAQEKLAGKKVQELQNTLQQVRHNNVELQTEIREMRRRLLYAEKTISAPAAAPAPARVQQVPREVSTPTEQLAHYLSTHSAPAPAPASARCAVLRGAPGVLQAEQDFDIFMRRKVESLRSVVRSSADLELTTNRTPSLESLHVEE